jgi:hypothetical protein
MRDKLLSETAMAVLVLVAVLAGLAVAGQPALAAAEPSQPSEQQPSSHTIVVGIPGLRWSDLSPNETPTLWRLADGGALAALSVRTVRASSCPADGWLTVNAGARAGARRSAGPEDRQQCVPPLEPSGDAASGFTVPNWADVLAYNGEFSYDPRFGLLARGAAQRGCATAVGPGAALALADRAGRLEHYRRSVAGADLAACPLTVIDLGELRPPYLPDRATNVRELDGDLAQLVARLPADATLLVAGLADSLLQPTHLALMLASGGSYEPRWLATRSTRQPGLAQVTDLTPTVLGALGVATPPGAVGSAMTNGPARPDVAEAVVQLAGRDQAAQTIRRSFNPFFWALAFGQILAYALLALALRRRPAHGRRWWRAVEGVALGFAAAPVASFLANLLPWWRFGRPGVALWTAVAVCCAAVGALAFVLPWRPRLLGPAGFVAATTALVLAVDVVVGSRLQVSSLYGLSPLTAGRFYGFGNIAFAVFAMSALLAATWVAGRLLARGRRAATLGVLVIGALAVVVDGWPSYGADFGGVLALVPGFAVLALGVSGAAASAVRLAAVGLAAIAAVTTIAVLDWTRPEIERSHLGRFVQQVVDGEAGAVLTRKLEANLSSLGQRPELAVLVPVAFVLLTAIVLRPDRLRVPGLARAYAEEPALKPGFVACLLTALLGFVVNDSGIIVPAVALAVATPLGVAVWAAAAHPRPQRSAAPRPSPEPARHGRHASRGSPGRPARR